MNAFWIAVARTQEDEGVLSLQFHEASTSFTEALFMLAFLDLPFKGNEPRVAIDNKNVAIRPTGPSIILQESTIPATPVADSQLGIMTRYYNARKRRIRLNQLDSGKPMLQRLVIQNFSDVPVEADLIQFIPNGAIPLLNHRGVTISRVTVPALRFITEEVWFYFPQTGKITLCPSRLYKGDALYAIDKIQVKQVRGHTARELDPWEECLQSNDKSKILNYLSEHDPKSLCLDSLEEYMTDRRFYQRLRRILQSKMLYSEFAWKYAFHHNDAEGMRDFLQTQRKQFLTGLYTSFITITPWENRSYQHLDFRPIFYARSHQTAAIRKGIQPEIKSKMRSLIANLLTKPKLSSSDHLQLAYYMLCMDRFDEAMTQFQQVNAHELECRLQYDYASVYLAFLKEDIKKARAIAQRYRNYQIPRWQQYFAEARRHLDEAEGLPVADTKAADKIQRMDRVVAKSPALELIDGLKVRYQNSSGCTVNYYPVDLETLFSSNPFAKGYKDIKLYAAPSHSQQLRFIKRDGITTIQPPVALQQKNYFLEIRHDGQVVQVLRQEDKLNINVYKRFGQLKVTDKQGKPLSKAYVKVYATGCGSSFYKDGYTDLRGRFDYCSLNTDKLTQVKAFSILITHPKLGSRLVSAGNPLEGE